MHGRDIYLSDASYSGVFTISYHNILVHDGVSQSLHNICEEHHTDLSGCDAHNLVLRTLNSRESCSIGVVTCEVSDVSAIAHMR
jgi:hypothetical protein